MRKFFTAQPRNPKAAPENPPKKSRLENEAPSKPQENFLKAPGIRLDLEQARKRRETRLAEFELRKNDPAFMENIFEMCKREMLTRKEFGDTSALKKHGLTNLRFADGFGNGEARLRAIAVPKDVMKSFQQGEKFYFRSGAKDPLVMCTANSTFTIQRNASDALFAVAPLRISREDERAKDFKECEIRAPVDSRLHLAIPRGNFDWSAVRRLLKEDELHHVEDEELTDISEDPNHQKRYSIRQLLRQLPISEGELRAFCKRLPIIDVDGKLVWMTPQYCAHLLDLLVDLFDEDTASEVNANHCTFDALRAAFPAEVPDSGIKWLIEQTMDSADDGVFTVNEAKLVNNRLRYILPFTPIRMYDDLARIVDRILPAGVSFKKEYLIGVAVTALHASGQEQLILLDKDDLPDEHMARVKAMFDARPVWPADEVPVYLEDVFPDRQKMEEFIFDSLERGEDDKGRPIYGGVIDPDI
ncbi:unnamed protein product, partial [Mesorhabditis spiculigera]